MVGFMMVIYHGTNPLKKSPTHFPVFPKDFPYISGGSVPRFPSLHHQPTVEFSPKHLLVGTIPCDIAEGPFSRLSLLVYTYIKV